MKKINKEYLWICYLVFVSVLGILFLTGHMPDLPIPEKATKTLGEQKTETMAVQETIAQQEETTGEENQTVAEIEVDPLAEEYNMLLEQVEEKEQQLKECQEQIVEEEETKFAVLHKYGEQMEGIRELYRPLIEYNVKNFEAKYDSGGSEIVQDVNQFYCAVGELSKYTPWGITINLFTSMAIYNSNADYSIMVYANNAFGTGIQKTIVATKAEVEEFTAKLDLYEMLTADSDSGNIDFAHYSDDRLKVIWENQYLMEYALKGEDVDLESYATEVRKKLYIMAAATKTLRDYYNTLLNDSANKTQSISKLEEQYREIMDIVDPDGTGEIAALVQSEELGEYIIPLIQAGMNAADGYAGLAATSPLVEYRFMFTTYGRCYWHYKTWLMKANVKNVNIYYADGKPVCVNGYFFYDGRLLNGNGNEDAVALYNNAVYMAQGSGMKQRECEMYIENILAARGD